MNQMEVRLYFLRKFAHCTTVFTDVWLVCLLILVN